MEEQNTAKTSKFSQMNKWMIISALMAVLLIVSIVFQVAPGITGMVINEKQAGEKAVEYIESNFGITASIIETGKENGLYYIDLSIEGQTFKMFMSKDGELLFPQVFVLAETEEPTETTAPVTSSVPKSDKPVVELFVMSHCPYGTQAEKGVLPVVEALGDKIDFNLRFVYYAMHGETEVYEQTTQYCIQKDQNGKLIDYLSCFLGEGKSDDCLTSTGIDIAKLNACVESAKEEFNIDANLEDESTWLSGRFPLFEIDMDLNQMYGIQGSPTLVINGVQASSARDSQSLLNVICDAFNTAPEECNTKLSTTAPSAGFGYGTGSNSDDQCS